jgi:hypothetical protein
MKIEDIEKHNKVKRTPAGNTTVITDIDTIESDEGWDEEYKEADSAGSTVEADVEEPEEGDDQPVHEPDDREGEEGAETPNERALQLLSAIETACRDLQNHAFAEEAAAAYPREATLLHRFVWLCALEICRRDSWDLTRWEQTLNPDGAVIFDGDSISGLADMVVPRGRYLNDSISNEKGGDDTT